MPFISQILRSFPSFKRHSEQLGIPKEAASLIEDTSRDTRSGEFMKMDQYVDVLIPRGGAGLIRAVVNQATIPVIETGKPGTCHIFVDETADFDVAVMRYQ